MGLLYEAECKGVGAAQLLADLPIAPDQFAQELVVGVDAHLEEVDGILSRQAVGWQLDRMPALDRVLLRIGVYELAFSPDVPVAVVLSEAVDLAGRFSTEESSRYVNGVLSALVARLRGDEAAGFESVAMPESPPKDVLPDGLAEAEIVLAEGEVAEGEEIPEGR